MFNFLNILGLLSRVALFLLGFFKKRREQREIQIPLQKEQQARTDNEKLLNAKLGDGTDAWADKLRDKDDIH